MRTNQIQTKITRIIDGEPVVFIVYSDANNFSEAFAAHCKAILDKVDVTLSFGVVETYDKHALTAEDIKPVRHGEWSVVWVDQGHIDMEKMYKCSICGGRKYNDYRYCPECGAEMNGGKK